MKKQQKYLLIIMSAALLAMLTLQIYSITERPVTNNMSREEYAAYLNYKKHYDLNNGTKLLVATRYGVDYSLTGRSLLPLLRLAMSGDKFAHAVLPFVVSHNHGGITREALFKMAAEEDEVVGLTLWGTILMQNGQFHEGQSYLTEAAKHGYIDAYSQLIRLYYDGNNFDKMCYYARDGYNKFGLEVLSASFLSNSTKLGEIYEHCNIFNEVNAGDDLFLALLDAEASHEASLIKAFYLTKKKEYLQAFALYEELSSSEVQKVAGNAKYCLGNMYMKGVGTQQDEQAGQALLKESLDMGQFLAIKPPLSGFAQLPQTETHIDFLGNNCGSI